MSKIIGSIAAVVATTLAANAEAKQPNILLILADDMGFECLGANGSTYKTPNLDQLAQKGILFTNSHAQPLSTPTRVQLMTGLYNNRNYTKFATLNKEQRTFAHMAKEQGYKTCIAGKWQLGADNKLPAHFGFDNYCLWQLTKKKNAGERYAATLYEQDGKAPVKLSIDGYGPDVFSDYICDFIDKNNDKPMFIYYPMVLIHDPFTPTPDSDGWKIEENRMKNNPNKNAPHMTAYADKLVGKLIAKLESEGVLENTLILFIGDNGTHPTVYTPMTDGTKYQGGKRGTLRNGTHVPMIAAWGDKIKPKQVNENLVDVTDFYPTIRDAIGAKESNDRKLDGISFYNQLIGKSYTPREWSFSHYPNQGNPLKYIRFVQTADYKLYSTGRFYNTRTDAKELKNITKGTADEEQIRKKLQDALDSFPAGSEILKGESMDITK